LSGNERLILSGNENIVAYVLLNVALGKEATLREEISKLNYVTEAKIVYGEYDIVVRIEAPTLTILDKLVSTIRRMSGVLKTVTLISTS